VRYFALSGRPLSEITIDAAVQEELTAADLRIHPDTLRHQADVAENDGNVQLADNFRRAAELAGVDDEDLLSIYEALRPRRSTLVQLETIASRLDSANAPSCAALVREAAEVYSRRGLLRPDRGPGHDAEGSADSDATRSGAPSDEPA
jgi:propanediol dehydratase small subunit